MVSVAVSQTAFPPWTELPLEPTASILQRLGPKELLQAADKVCATWRRVCKTPTFWRAISIRNFEPIRIAECNRICRRAVDLSDGELIDLTIENFADADLMYYIAERSSKLRRLTIANKDPFNHIPGRDRAIACSGFPFLEELHILSPFSIANGDLAEIGIYCPLFEGNAVALAIADNIANLRQLRLLGNPTLDNNGVQAILEDCPRLKSLDLRRCRGVDLEGEIGVQRWVWMREELQDTSCLINIYCKNYVNGIFSALKVLEQIDEGNIVQPFRDGCFGHLIDYVGGNSNNAALLALFTREIIMECARKNERWFNVGGTNIRFLPAEFALVSGLKFGGTDLYPYKDHKIPESILFYRVLDGKPISVWELCLKVTSLDLGDEAEVEDYLKAANVVILYNLVLGFDIPHLIDPWVWALVEDRARWNDFPWGSLSFGALMHYMNLIPRGISDLEKQVKKKSYHLYGPAWILQLECYVYLVPSDVEMGKPYYLSTQVDDHVGVSYLANRNKTRMPRYHEVAEPGTPSQQRNSGPMLHPTIAETGVV
ncbi:hypothetical protein C2S51_007539 [Perilla frutescens var. frutescens]|nr:hypothetical protein C2S51_007539 [Perilla frutescens var. frutescens]